METLRAKLFLKFPGSVDDFLASEVYPELPPALVAFFMTVQPTFQDTRQPFLDAATILGLRPFVEIGPLGPDIRLRPAIYRWREHTTVRIFIEACMLAGIGIPIIAEDLRRVWSLDVSEDDLHAFRFLFADPDGLRGGWFAYEKSIGQGEADFKHRLVGQPHDFVRWKLGVPVCLESDQVINRLVSDAYYTERQIKFEAGDGALNLTKDQLARVKMERDAIFKALNLRQKIADSKSGSTNQAAQSAVADFIAKVSLITVPTGGPAGGPLASELMDQNAQLPPQPVAPSGSAPA